MDRRNLNCEICGEEQQAVELRQTNITLDAARDPEGDEAGPRQICRTCLHRLRTERVRTQMEQERDELLKLETQALANLRDRERTAENFNKEYDRQLTTGERIADRIAEFGGSWPFIFLFFAVIAVWVGLNSSALLSRPFDPFPFILLNLALSLLAAIQAPVIMMSQNRQTDRDRLRAESDYKINLKAEIEIRTLNGKMDQLLRNQWVRLLEIQQIQMDMLNDLAERQKPDGRR